MANSLDDVIDQMRAVGLSALQDLARRWTDTSAGAR